MLRLVSIALAVLFSFGSVNAAGLYPLSNYQQFDANGKLLAGAKLYLFDGGTTTPRIGYKDSSLTSPHPNPILADASGRLPLIYLDDGFYRQRLTTKTGTQIFDQDGIPVLSTTAGGSGTSVDPDSVFKARDIKIRFDNQPLAGYVRLNGRTIGSASSGATERANIDTQPLYEELWSFASIAVVGGKGASAAADYAANKPLSLPNAAGRGLFGADDLGAGPQNVLTTATIPFPSIIGAISGYETVTISQSMLPSYLLTGGTGNAAVSGTTGIESAAHNHTFSGTTAGMNANNPHSHSVSGGIFGGTTSGLSDGSNRGTPIGASGIVINSADIQHGHDYSGTTSGESATHNHSFSGTGLATSVSILSGGSGAASPNLPPIMLFMIYIRL